MIEGGHLPSNKIAMQNMPNSASIAASSDFAPTQPVTLWDRVYGWRGVREVSWCEGVRAATLGILTGSLASRRAVRPPLSSPHELGKLEHCSANCCRGFPAHDRGRFIIL